MNTVSPWFLRAALTGLLCLTFAACDAQSQVEIEQGEEETIVEGITSPSHSERLYVSSNEEYRRALRDGILDLEPPNSFMGVFLNMRITTSHSFEIAYTRASDGSMSEFKPLILEQAEDENISIGVPFNDVATKVHLRFLGDPEGVDFIRAEFVEVAEPEADIYPDHETELDAHGDEIYDELTDEVIKLEVSRPGRYIPDAETVRIGRGQSIAYQGAGTRCGSGMLPGARKFGQYMVNHFKAVRSYQGFNCRKVRGGSSLSQHAVGRAVDLMIPTYKGQADNTEADGVANWIIRNAQQLGIQYLIWDRTSWSGSRSGDKHRHYTGQHPHHDHIHAEFTWAGARGETPWFRNGGPNRAPGATGGGGGSPSGPVTCNSKTLGRNVSPGSSVQMSYAACGQSRCGWATCDAQGNWDCHGPEKVNRSQMSPHAACAGVNQPPASTPAPAPAPAPQPSGKSCYSRSLGQSVAHGACVQMNYNSCGGTGACQYAACNNGGWTCQPVAQCSGQKYAHNDCKPKPAPKKNACYSKTLGRSVAHGEAVQMSYTSCGGRCRYATCNDGGWTCGSGGATKRHSNRACGS